ncbi:MAG: PHP domain-containing protein [Spirochaetota bacterium]|nr:PHP domain-containing protein [Thermodesulfobacteriota bacterium]MDY6968583.1 PHP domain-containing protein [Spirochaetota bacterium]
MSVKIDLHIHTYPMSTCSEMSPEEALEESVRLGLTGVCFTEHNKPWDTNELDKLRENFNILILSGMEVDTTEGHIVTYGLHRELEGITPIEDLKRMVDEVNGFMAAAHPFRGFLVFGLSKLRLDVDQESSNSIFKFVDAVEICSGRQTASENDFSSQVCDKLNLKGIGGSDAHSIKQIGTCVTVFENDIKDEADLIRELRIGRYKTDIFKK